MTSAAPHASQGPAAPRESGAPLAPHWSLDPDIDFLNHGSFGACPIAVLQTQTDLRQRMERNPVQFLDRDLEGLLDEAAAELGALIGARPEDLAWLPNATTGVNTVVRSLALAPGDELLATDHIYNACRNALEVVARATGARVVVAQVPFPLTSPDEVVEAIVGAATLRTRLALIDHVTSPTGLVLPVRAIVDALQGRGIDVLVDGAHAPGMVPLELDDLGAAFYTGNCHKWLCAPKGAAFLHVRRDRQAHVHPLATSHGYNDTRTERTRFQLEFGWTGTDDPTACLCVPVALRHLGSLAPGGWPAWMAANRELAIAARDLLCAALGVDPPCPDTMLGSLASVPLPAHLRPEPSPQPSAPDPLQEWLRRAHRIEVPIVPWRGGRLVRVSAQGYNHLGQYGRLAGILRAAAMA